MVKSALTDHLVPLITVVTSSILVLSPPGTSLENTNFAALVIGLATLVLLANYATGRMVSRWALLVLLFTSTFSLLFFGSRGIELYDIGKLAYVTSILVVLIELTLLILVTLSFIPGFYSRLGRENRWL